MDSFELMRDRISQCMGKFEGMKNLEAQLTEDIKSANSEINYLEKASEFLIDFSEETRRNMKNKIESLANSALKIVFPNKRIVFKLIPQKTSRGVNYNTYAETDGVIDPLLDSKGGGVKDIISICIRISYLRMLKSKLRQILILDEPFKNIDKVRLQIAIDWLRKVSKEFGIQFIIITHIVELVALSDNGMQFKLKKGVTHVEQ